ncbi:exopolysaccharide transport family protein [Prosthecobacter dejongeii]|uniref:non-specific protein-tyrosine kinase n=1 Tax=Prosthecobacter dejongeii TaxID=48465 RepID=A0A7W8DNH5_9BACT|nr:polysaccharide biosynthesis tyrosine autokinase [Prosthecobacter dejongeii]MBB5036095.1 capsular exopolysaccharide synthesis family protein [Prosthecobacter dejongeii]
MRDTGNELQQQAMDSWQVIRNRFGLIILSFLLVFATAAIITYIMPRKYRGLVEMKIERVQNKVQVFQRSTDDFMAPSDVVIKNEFESITKPETLYPVVDKLDLQKRWSMPNRQSALAKLRGNLDTQSSVRSDFVTIEFYDQDPNTAAEIANAVAQSYMTRRVEVESKQKNEALTMLGKQIAEQEEQRSQARLTMQEAKKKGGIVGEWFSNGTNSTTPGANLRTTEDSMVVTREQALLQADLEVQSLSAEIDELSKLEGDELVARASGLKLENANVTSMMADLNKLQVTREGLVNAGRGRKHPEVEGVDSQIVLSKQLILDAVKSHLSALQTRLDFATKRRASLQNSNNDAKKDMLDQQSAQNDYKTAADEVAYIESLLTQLKSSYFQTKAELELVKSPATIYAVATPEGKPTKPNVALNLALGGVLGLMLGVGLAFFLEYMDTSVKSLDDVERFLGVPVLAVIPKDVAVLHRASGFNPDAEAYRILRTNIEFNRRNPDANCITVTSGGAGEGKSTTLCNLAFVCAQGGYSVLLIDADLRRPRMHTMFDVSNTVGLTNYLTTNVQLEEVVVRTPVENLYFLPSGMLPADSAGVLNSQRMSELIADAKSRFDLVLIDSPPILGVSDASVLANEADLTLIVVQHRKLPRHMLLRVKQTVENVGGNVLGVVLNNVDLRSDSQYQYYTSYYTYYSPDNMAAPAGNKPERRKKQTSAPQPVAGKVASSNTPRGDLF